MTNSDSATGDKVYGSLEGELLDFNFGATSPPSMSPYRIVVTQSKIVGVTIPSITKIVNPEARLEDIAAGSRSAERPISDLTRIYLVNGKAGKDYAKYAETNFHMTRDTKNYSFIFFVAIQKHLTLVIPAASGDEVRAFIGRTPLGPKMMLMGKWK